jgi:hypothetical protein
MEKAKFLHIFNYKNFENLDKSIIYLGHETCQEFFYKNLDFYKKIVKKTKEKNDKISFVLVIPPLTDLYFDKIVESIINNKNLFEEITVNDFGTFFKLKDYFKVNLGRQLIKFKAGNINLDNYKGLIKENELKEIKKPLISDLLIKKFEKEINLIELNPVIQKIDLSIFEKMKFKFALHWPFVLNTTTFMCWSKVEKMFRRVVNCDLSCKFARTNFLENSYFIKGNANYFKNPERLEEYLDKIVKKELIERVIFHSNL